MAVSHGDGVAKSYEPVSPTDSALSLDSALSPAECAMWRPRVNTRSQPTGHELEDASLITANLPPAPGRLHGCTF